MSLLPTSQQEVLQLQRQLEGERRWSAITDKQNSEMIKALQSIRLVCQRAKAHYIEESDIDEILEITKQHV